MTDAFYKYAKRLLFLALLSQTGRNDSKEADVVRGEMAEYWKKLTPKEIEVANTISTTLYTLEDEEDGELH